MQKAVKDSLYSFPKVSRLCYQHDFSNVFTRSDGRLATSPWILLYAKNDLPYSRLGIVIKKSLVRRAVDRNRLRRVMRDRFRCCALHAERRQKTSVPDHSFDVIILVDKSIMHSMHKVRVSAEALWQQFILL